MILLLIILVSIQYIAAQTVQDVLLQPGQSYEIHTPNYPDILDWGNSITLEWNIKVDNDAKIKLVCPDIRMVQRPPWSSDCPSVYFSIIDGDKEKKYCSDGIRDLIYKSDGSNLKVKMVTTKDGSGLAKCIAISLGEPKPEEIIELHPNGRAREFKIEGKNPNLDHLWVFNSPEGTRMSFQCTISLDHQEPICGWNAVTFNNGEVDEEVCEFRDFLWFSKANHAKLRIQLDSSGNGRMDCIVQAVTGPHRDEYENAVSEEVDSSEHGVTPGHKKTSCECGWANKGVARIIYGNETRVNEFPWMVHLYVNHIKDDGFMGTTCGASIITARHVLTAAHCVVIDSVLAKPENIRMELAKHDAKKPTGKEIIIGAEQVFVREIYMKEGLYSHDIALIFTKERINFSPVMGPVCLQPNTYPPINRQLIIMGWGKTEDGSFSSYLRKGKSRVIDPLLCGAQNWEVCTTNVPNSFCSGDSGGPLVILNPETNRYSQMSLVSRGSSCFGGTQVSTYVAFFYDWLQEKIKETDPSVQTCY
uniref:Venom s1 protease 28 n=1 Tax=Pristhesancus plagipennis TaxID=1955184 RepID=A0A1Q1NP89_PRIPG|nr:venom s1 protease 28 [Pristhesancus plagipennis]